MLLPLLAYALAGTPGPALHVGDTAYLFSLPALNEDAALHDVARTSVALSDYTGVMPGFPAKAVVVSFLRREGGDGVLLALDKIARRYDKQGVRVVAILAGPGDIASVSDWVESQHLDFPVLRDVHEVVVDRYGVKAFPMTFVINGDGDVAAIGTARTDLEQGLDTVITGIVGK